MDDSSVVFKGTVNGLTILFKENENFNEILKMMENKIESSGKFFRGAVLDVKYKGKKLTKEQEILIYKMMVLKSGAEIKSFSEDMEEVVNIQSSIPIVPQQSKIKIRNYFFKGIEEGMTKFHRGTVRSGQLVNFDGNLTIIGDVNPGGEVVAAGNVIVMGSLRGIVRAGVDGNKEALIVALNLQPMQLSIADIITRSPDEEKILRNSFTPEMAYIKDNQVYIERYLPQR